MFRKIIQYRRFNVRVNLRVDYKSIISLHTISVKVKKEADIIMLSRFVHERYIPRAVVQRCHRSGIHNLADNEILPCSVFSKFV